MQMESQSQDDKLITRYLLGELTEDEQTTLEERAFSDRDYFQQVRAVEKDLIDEYARGELSGPARQAFEQRFVASDSRRLLIGSRGSNRSHIEQAGTQPPSQGTPQSQGSASPQPTTDQSAHNGAPTPLPQGSPSASPQQQV